MEIDKVAEIVLGMEVNRVTDEPDKVDAEVADTVQTSVEMAGEKSVRISLCFYGRKHSESLYYVSWSVLMRRAWYSETKPHVKK